MRFVSMHHLALRRKSNGKPLAFWNFQTWSRPDRLNRPDRLDGPDESVSTNQRPPLLILQAHTPTPDLHADAPRALDDPHQRQDGKRQRAPVDELARLVHGLVREDREEREGDGDGGGEVALGGGERVGRGGALEEEEREEDEDLGPDPGGLLEGVDAEGLEGGEDDKDGGPAVVEGEGEVDEELVGPGLGRVIFLHDVVDVLWEG